jgi:diaminopimelate epimerase
VVGADNPARGLEGDDLPALEPETLELWRLSGAGNDFLALVDPPQPPSSETIRAWCTRGSSLGADGLFLLYSADPLEMVYHNADGGAAALCLNGTRCAAQLAFHLGLARTAARIATGAGELLARRRSPTEVELDAPLPAAPPRALEIETGGRRLSCWLLQVGVPHLVLPWGEPLARCPVSELGASLRRHPDVGAEGANVDFVHFLTPSSFQIRTFERGVEAETLACGTGVLAAAAVGLRLSLLELPSTAHTRGGFDLTVGGQAPGGEILGWTLAGDARVLARATVFAAAQELPKPPEWG